MSNYQQVCHYEVGQNKNKMFKILFSGKLSTNIYDKSACVNDIIGPNGSFSSGM